MTTLIVLAIAATLLPPAAAFADGDPASDVLIASNVFYPFSPVSADLQRRLNAETAAAIRVGLAMKVALIHGPDDLGAVPSLFGKPQQYATFLAQEISFVNPKQTVLIVMPNGFGLAGSLPAATAARAAAALGKPAGSSTDDLASSAISAVAQIAAAAGHPIGIVTRPASSSSGSGVSPVLAVAVLAAASIAVAGAILALRWARARTRS
jgi:hypothetical protein